jgi:PAS domain S-box-containing protein
MRSTAEFEQLECAHRELEAKLKLGISLAGFGLCVIDYLSDHITFDKLAGQLLDFPADTPVLRSEAHTRFHTDGAEVIKKCIQDALDPNGNGFMAVEHRMVLTDGRVRWVAVQKQIEFAQVEPGGPIVPTKGLCAIRDITNQKAAENNVRVSETRYRRMFEAAHDGVLLLDPATGKIVDANPFMTRLLGYSRTELLGRQMFEIGLLSDQDSSRRIIRDLSRTLQVRYEDLPLETKEGELRAVEVVASLYEEDGLEIIQCNIRDITQRRLLEASLKQNAQMLSILIDQAPSGVYLVDGGFRLTRINRVARPIFEQINPLIGRDFADILAIVWGPIIGRKIEAIFRHTLLTGDAYISPPFSEMRGDLGILQSFEWEIQRVTLQDGQLGVVCYFKDVTEESQARDIATERALHVRSILDNTQAYIGLLDTEGTLLEVNTAALHAANAERESVVGRKLWDHVWWGNQSDEVERLKDAVARAATGETVRYDMVLNLSDSVSVDVDFMLAPVRDASGKITLLVPSGINITDRKTSFRQIQMLMGEVNHRAMNLLSVVLAVARQTMRAGDPALFVTQLTERITGLAASQDLLVRNNWQGVDVGDLVRAQLNHYRGQFPTQILIEGPPARLSATAAQGIGMALHELATNASKYGSLSVVDGKVDITWTTDGASVGDPLGDQSTFELNWRESGGPTVTPPTRKGFGQKVIGPIVEAAVNGQTTLDYATSGLCWTLFSPLKDTIDTQGGKLFAKQGL